MTNSDSEKEKQLLEGITWAVMDKDGYYLGECHTREQAQSLQSIVNERDALLAEREELRKQIIDWVKLSLEFDTAERGYLDKIKQLESDKRELIATLRGFILNIEAHKKENKWLGYVYYLSDKILKKHTPEQSQDK
jgi:hypothetical protein